MKILFNGDPDHLVGETYLNNEILEMLKRGETFILGCSLTKTAEIVAISLSPILSDSKLTWCNNCGVGINGEKWKCCSIHTTEHGPDLFCRGCVLLFHPEYFNGG